MADVPSISIVDDDPSVRKALDRLCKSVGYDVKLFESAEAFLDADAAEMTDFLILDVHLPRKSGLDVQAELVAADRRRPTVFITAFDDDAARIKALKDGALDFLGKPLDVDHLLDLIEQALREA